MGSREFHVGKPNALHGAKRFAFGVAQRQSLPTVVVSVAVRVPLLAAREQGAARRHEGKLAQA